MPLTAPHRPPCFPYRQPWSRAPVVVLPPRAAMETLPLPVPPEAMETPSATSSIIEHATLHFSATIPACTNESPGVAVAPVCTTEACTSEATKEDGSREENYVVPKVGTIFNLEEEAYEMYNSFAGKVGFSIRKGHSKLRPDRTIYHKYIVCSNKGEQGNHLHDTLNENARTRTKCNARVQFSICRKSIWTKYPKREYFSKRQGDEKETVQTHVARISRKVTSIALKSTVSEQLLDNLESALNKLDLEADNYIAQMPTKSSESSAECSANIPSGNVSFRPPPVIGGKRRRQINVLNKKKGNNKKKGKDMNMTTDEVEDGRTQAATNKVEGQQETMIAPFIQGAYTSLLLGVEDATQKSANRRLFFDELTDDVSGS